MTAGHSFMLKLWPGWGMAGLDEWAGFRGAQNPARLLEVSVPQAGALAWYVVVIVLIPSRHGSKNAEMPGKRPSQLRVLQTPPERKTTPISSACR